MIDLQKLVAVELFSGAGGLSIGLEKAGFQVILANEIEQDFVKSFTLNHPHSKGNLYLFLFEKIEVSEVQDALPIFE